MLHRTVIFKEIAVLLLFFFTTTFECVFRDGGRFDIMEDSEIYKSAVYRGEHMEIVYKKLTATELETFIKMRINQLREEGAKEDIYE